MGSGGSLIKTDSDLQPVEPSTLRMTAIFLSVGNSQRLALYHLAWPLGPVGLINPARLRRQGLPERITVSFRTTLTASPGWKIEGAIPLRGNATNSKNIRMTTNTIVPVSNNSLKLLLGMADSFFE